MDYKRIIRFFFALICMVFILTWLHTYRHGGNVQIYPLRLDTGDKMLYSFNGYQLHLYTEHERLNTTRQPAKRKLNTSSAVTSSPVTSSHVTSSHVTSSPVKSSPFTSSHVTSRLELNLKLKHINVFVYDVSDWNTKIEKCYGKASRRNTLYLVVKTHGFGEVLNTTFSGISIRTTYPRGLSYMFYDWLQQSKYVTITKDKNKADLFYIPLYHTLGGPVCDSLFQKTRKYYDRILKPKIAANLRKPHVLVTGKTEQHPPSALPGALNVVLERDDKGRMHTSNSRKERPQVLVVPYPSSPHFTVKKGGEYVRKLFDYERQIHILFVGKSRGGGHGPRSMRKKIVDQISHETKQSFKEFASHTDLITVTSIAVSPYGTSVITEWMRNSVFCLQPPGDTNARKSFYDAMMCGCIPVTFQLSYLNHVTYPFERYLDYSHFSVKIPLSQTFESVLGAYRNNTSLIRSLQRNLTQVLQYLQYNDPTVYDEAGTDAFTVILSEIQRILLSGD